METIIMDGKGLAKKMQDQMKKQVAALTAEGKTPGLCVILVGEDKASQVYVRNKEKQSEAMGMNSRVVRLAADISEADLLAEVEKQNQDDSMHGILVQLPLPKALRIARSSTPLAMVSLREVFVSVRLYISIRSLSAMHSLKSSIDWGSGTWALSKNSSGDETNSARLISNAVAIL